MRALGWLAAVLLLTGPACGTMDRVDAGDAFALDSAGDAGRDVRDDSVDASADIVDAAANDTIDSPTADTVEAATDAGTLDTRDVASSDAVDVTTSDVRADTPGDAPTEAAIDVVVDSRTDVGADTSTDAATDTIAPIDGGVSPTVFVLRVGDGTAALTNASTAIFLEEHRVSDGSLVGTPIAMPVAMSGTNRPLTLSGTATSEGGLSLSGDGRFLVVGGYASAPGMASIAGTTSAAVNRVIGRVDRAGGVNTSSLLDAAYSGNNIRGATTNDGSVLWATGTASSAGGVYSIALGTTGGTQVAAMPSNLRHVGIFEGQLYASASSSPNFGIVQIGTGLPTIAGATGTLLSGFPVASGPSSYGFAGFRRGMGTGIDTLYVADDRAPSATGGGVQRWQLMAGTWTLTATFFDSLTAGVRSLAAYVDGANVVVVASTAETPQRLIAYTDTGTVAPVARVLATAAANAAYRGVALAPR